MGAMIARKSALIIASQVANGILGYVGLKFIALYMEPWQYGVIGFAFGFVSIFKIVGKLGFDQAHIKRVSEGKDLGRCIATYLSTKLGLAGLLAAVVIGAVAVWTMVLGRGFESPVHEQALYVMLAYFFLFTLRRGFIYTFMARKEMAKANLPRFAFTVGRIAVTVFVALSGLGALALAYAYLAGEILEFVLALYFHRGYPVGSPSLDYLKSYKVFALHVVVAVAGNMIILNVDKVFIQLFWGAEQVGRYFAMHNLSRFITVFVTAVSSLLFPTISALHAKNNTREIERLTLVSERYMSMIVFPMVVGMAVLAGPAIRILLSNKYLPAVTVLQVLPFFVLLQALQSPYNTLARGINRPQVARNAVVIMAAANVLLNLLLVPRDIQSLGVELVGLGSLGAAIATVASFLAGLLYIRWVAWRLTGITVNYRIALHAVAAGVMAFALYQLQGVWFIGRWYELIAASLLGLGIYIGVLFVMREFTKDDFDFFMDALNIRKMFAYIWDEITG